MEAKDFNVLPRHVAVIMDGNGRWAQKQAHRRIFGHQHAMTAVHEAVEAAGNCGVKYLTLYTFSTENWNRPQDEIDGLMELIIKAVHDETKTLMDHSVKLETIGDTQRIPERSRNKLLECMKETANNTAMTLVVALSYSARWETAKALRQICVDARDGRLTPESITEETFRNYLTTKNYPDPDLLIRTGGELRISNFLLWQMAYTEFYFSDQLWPDFRLENFYDAVYDYQNRQRRFGKTGDQVAK
jgi:undecaprenyl diphosphate synthase